MRTRFVTYDVTLDAQSTAYREAIMRWPAVIEWIDAARAEPAELEALEVEF